MVTWWLVGKEYQPRDSLTGIKISRNEDYDIITHTNKKICITMEDTPPRHDTNRQSWPAARRRGDGNHKVYTTARRGSSCSANSCTSDDSSRLRNIREEGIPTKTTFYSQLASPTIQELLPSNSSENVSLPGTVIDTHQNQQ